MRPRTGFLFGVLALGAAVGGGWYWWQAQNNRLPPHIASGNGRIEAEQVHVAAKYAGRIADISVDEGDRVAQGQVVARMETAELDASFAKARAELARAQEAVAEARAQIVQRKSAVLFARQELDRASTLVEKGHVSKERLDQRQAEWNSAVALLDAAKAHAESMRNAVLSATAEMARIQAQIDDTVLTAPRDGRVQYRLAEPGEVLTNGGRVITLLDLTDVYMTIFLPTAQTGRTFVGSEARILLDAAPEFVIPAKVTFVAAEAQFTLKEVETRSERDKLMFRVKVKIEPEVLRAHSEKVRSGLPGEAYVLLGSNTSWPDRFAIRLPAPRLK